MCCIYDAYTCTQIRSVIQVITLLIILCMCNSMHYTPYSRCNTNSGFCLLPISDGTSITINYVFCCNNINNMYHHILCYNELRIQCAYLSFHRVIDKCAVNGLNNICIVIPINISTHTFILFLEIHV